MKERRKIKRGKYRRGVFVIIYLKEKGRIEYLILRRKHHWKGWEFSKGGANFLETNRHAARREAREESGLKILKLKRFPYSGKYKYSMQFPDRPGIIGQTFTLFAAEAKKGRVKLDRKEHSGYKWMSYSQALGSVKFANQKKALKIVNSWLKKIS
jgi:8-oxo-dGTP pyrophosphatase MutT (NUDIX family)